MDSQPSDEELMALLDSLENDLDPSSTAWESDPYLTVSVLRDQQDEELTTILDSLYGGDVAPNPTALELLRSLEEESQSEQFAEMSSLQESYLEDLYTHPLFSNENESTMTTEELFGVDTDCSSRTKCDKDTNKTEEEAVVKMVDEDKSCATTNIDDDMQDLYSSHNYGLLSSRPTMISPKYRQKEERRKLMKMCMKKLARIDDPESSLRRSVLINNAVKRLQREAREEKLQKSQRTMSYSQSKCFGISSDFITKQEQNLKVDVFATSLSSRTADQLLDITNLPDGKTCVSKCDSDCLDCDEAISDLAFPGDHRSSHHMKMSRKRSIDETLDEECDAVLSQFYLQPPTPQPRIIPSLYEDEDEDEDVNVVDIDTTPAEPPVKRKREDCCDNTRPQDSVACCLTAADRLRDNLPSSFTASTTSSSTSATSLPSTTTTTTTTSSTSASLPSPCTPFEDWVMDESILLQTASIQAASHTTPSSPFSCGHSSMLNEIVVYHNLIASFES